MIIYRKPAGRRQQTVIAHCLTDISLSASSTPSQRPDGIVLDVKGSPHQNGQASKYIFQVFLDPDDLALLNAARERFNAGGDLPYSRLGLSVRSGIFADSSKTPDERLVLRFSSYERDEEVRL